MIWKCFCNDNLTTPPIKPWGAKHCHTTKIKKHEKDIIDDNIPGRYRGIRPGTNPKGS